VGKTAVISKLTEGDRSKIEQLAHWVVGLSFGSFDVSVGKKIFYSRIWAYFGRKIDGRGKSYRLLSSYSMSIDCRRSWILKYKAFCLQCS
jgi:hypothetical protein